MAEANDSDDEWFNKSESELLESIKSCPAKVNVSPTEFVKVALPTGTTDTILSISAIKKTTKLTTAELRSLSKQEPLDIFLYAFTKEDYFNEQIKPQDSQERFLLYLQTLAVICNLRVPGYVEILLKIFAADQFLLDQISTVCSKLFNKKLTSLWTKDERVDIIFRNMQTLLLQCYLEGFFTPQCVSLLRHIMMLWRSSESTIAHSTECLQFVKHLERILEKIDENMNTPPEQDDIWPTLNELNDEDADFDSETELPKEYANVEEYIKMQKKLLREDFMMSLHNCVRTLKATGTLDELPQMVLYTDVQIVPNEDMTEASRNEMLFLDVLGSSQNIRNLKQTLNNPIIQEFRKLKTGTLLCLTTSKEFNDLILATVTSTRLSLRGYIGIVIGRQYNIGNIYGKKLLMFETPAFFEAYRNAYNFLCKCNSQDFPMKNNIIFGMANTKRPLYLSENTEYTYKGTKFSPEDPPAQLFPLNHSQRTAFARMLTENFCIVQGPPGTGKTHLSAHVVRTLIANAPTPIVLTTYTNESLDKFLLQLSEHTDNIMRFGGQSRLPEIKKFTESSSSESDVNPRLKRLYYITKINFEEKFYHLKSLHTEFDGTEENYCQILAAQKELRIVVEKLDSIRNMFNFYSVRKKGLIAMTTTCAAKLNFLFRLLRSKIVIFEEAAEILESHVLAALTPFTGHIIMIGDHMQLQPYTSSFKHRGSSAIKISLFERMINTGMHFSILTTQYRMRPAIANLICPLFYKELKNADNVMSYPMVRKMNKNVFFHTHSCKESKSERECSVQNEYEVKEVIILAKFLTNEAMYMPYEIVILSPYAEQIEHIKKKLASDDSLQKVKAATVDSFQGLEADIVLLSLVRSNKHEQIGFLKDKNRICVALSRAKQGLFIVGNICMLSACSDTWNEIEKILKQQDAIGHEFPFQI